MVAIKAEFSSSAIFYKTVIVTRMKFKLFCGIFSNLKIIIKSA